MSDRSAIISCCGACCGLLLVIAAGLVGGSFTIVEPQEYALLQNTISKEVTADRVYTSGRFFVGLARAMIIYPRTRQNVYFGSSAGADSPALRVQINQGQVSVECGLQYSLNYTALVGVYRNFGTAYHRRFVSLVAAALPTAFSTSVNITDFYMNRGLIQQIALDASRAILAPQGAQVHDFQLRSVTLPTDNENRIIQKLVSDQAAQTASNVQQQSQINALISVVVGQIQQEIGLYQSNQTQIAAVLTQTAAATAKALQLDSKSTAYTAFQSVLGFNSSELLRYLYLKNLRAAPATATLAVGFDSNTLWQNA